MRGEAVRGRVPASHRIVIAQAPQPASAARYDRNSAGFHSAGGDRRLPPENAHIWRLSAKPAKCYINLVYFSQLFF